MPTIEYVKEVMRKVEWDDEIDQDDVGDLDNCEVVIFEKFGMGHCYIIVLKEPDGQYDGYMYTHGDDECISTYENIMVGRTWDQFCMTFWASYCSTKVYESVRKCIRKRKRKAT